MDRLSVQNAAAEVGGERECCASAYISQADGWVGQSFGNDGQSSVRFGQNQHGFGRVSG